MTTRILCVVLAVVSLAACDDDDKKKRLESMGTVPSAPPPWASAAAKAGASAEAVAPSASAAAAPPVASAPVKLTGTKALVERLQGGKWVKQLSDAEKASNQAELDKAEQALKAAKTEDEKRAAKGRKITVEEVAFTWTEFTPKKRVTRAPPARLVVERPYEVTKSEGNVLTLRVWDQINPTGGFETYTFLDDNTVRLVQGDSSKFEILTRR